ncbi:MFS transporter [Sphingobium sp. SCG-1]|uniref:MFS transporter n=1 Tax=Sphingobium sp. SCG-1 TaxID=2072936 RepID=UPI0011AB2D22|nr:MFS transporter [Sphingobium sp. SCG-1]
MAPQQTVSPGELQKGIRYLLMDAAAATAIGALNSGVVLLALALHIGATNVQIGLLAAIPLLTQIMQAPAVKLVEKVRRRKLISVVSVFVARLALPIYAAVPFLSDRNVAAMVLIAAALLHYGMNAVGACSWNSWIRDLIPSDRLGRFTASRTVYGTTVSTFATLGAAAGLHAAQGSEQAADQVFTVLYLLGFGFGLISTGSLARVPEPVIGYSAPAVPLHKMLWAPLRDSNFRNILRFLASWQFATNLATPFFTVYFVKELGFPVEFVLILTIVSQLANIIVIRSWGRLSDRFTNKSVLSVASPLFILSIVGMILATEFHSHEARMAYLVGLHVVMGAAGAGVGLASSNIVMKLSPSGAATHYMATNALIGALAAGVAPIIGGLGADLMAQNRLELNLTWFAPQGARELASLTLAHWQFFFLLSALMGLYALHRLATIQEPGAVERSEVVQHVWSSARRSLRNASSVAGLRLAIGFPGGELIKLRERGRLLLERLYETAGSHREQKVRAEAVGTLLSSAFKEPSDDGSAFDDLLSRMK